MNEDRILGSLLGLAVGDALGATVEFQARDSFPPVTDMVGGGVFGLAPGQWTDDTSMALCIAASLIETGAYDPRDQLARFVRWYRDGYLSSTGRCFDIGNQTLTALEAFMRDIQPFMVADALADFTEEEHRMACEYASGRCARVLDTAEVLEQITAGAPGADGAPETGKVRA